MDGIEWDVDNPQVKKLIEAAQVLHWGTMSIGLALGLRSAIKAMGALGLQRKQADRVKVRGSYCFAQGVEAITGCSTLRGKMEFEHRSKGETEFHLWGQGKHLRVKPYDRVFRDGKQVMELEEKEIFERIEMLDV
ncbi:MAG TPA: FmdE family protein [Clostridia bacterium]|nr:FmdE family protein [Clostridia bacterium]